MKMPKKVEVKYHYNKEDADCNGDFYNVELYFDGKPILELSDDYHDGASRQIEGYLKACKLFFGKDFPKVIETSKNDSDY